MKRTRLGLEWFPHHLSKQVIELFKLLDPGLGAVALLYGDIWSSTP